MSEIKNGSMPLFGLISAKAAISASARRIDSLWVNVNPKKRNVKLFSLLRLCEAKGIPVAHMSRDDITEGCGDSGHGGVVLWVGERPFASLESLFDKPPGPLFLVEGIEDPYNFGTLARSLYMSGAQGLILPPRNWMTAAGIVARAAAGTSEHLPMAVYQTADELQNAIPPEYRFIIADENAENTLHQANLGGKIIIGVGGEKRGLSADIKKLADETIRIPYTRQFEMSLPAHIAATLVAFEIQRQRELLQKEGNI